MGIPSVALLTKAFDVLSVTVAKGVGYPDLERHVLPHPLNPLPEAQVRKIGHDQLNEILGKLMKGNEQ